MTKLMLVPLIGDKPWERTNEGNTETVVDAVGALPT